MIYLECSPVLSRYESRGSAQRTRYLESCCKPTPLVDGVSPRRPFSIELFPDPTGPMTNQNWLRCNVKIKSDTTGCPSISQEKLAFWVLIITGDLFSKSAVTGRIISNSISELEAYEGWPSNSPKSRSGKRSSLRASDFRKDSIRAKQAIAELIIGTVDTKTFMRSFKSEINESAVYADAVFSVLPVEFATITKTANVNSGASVLTLLPAIAY
jgi:hypothetical protein